MRFVTVRDFRTRPAAIWEELPGIGEIVITNNGRPIALLTPVSDATLEEDLAVVRRARALQAVERMRRLSLERGNDTMPIMEIDYEIAAARRSR
jgi:antitoxin (DNA-binding transcriptional repressor) of toxin-antitoxin stability system